MLIHHLVPGQEEGNLRLLETIGCGGLAEVPRDLTAKISAILAARAASWRSMKYALASHNRNAGAIVAARCILQKTEDLKTEDTR